jgi:hypothetical protein
MVAAAALSGTMDCCPRRASLASEASRLHRGYEDGSVGNLRAKGCHS